MRLQRGTKCGAGRRGVVGSLAAGLVGAALLGGSGVAQAAVTPEPELMVAEDDVLATIGETPETTTTSYKVFEDDLPTVQVVHDGSTYRDVSDLFSQLVAADRVSARSAASVLDGISRSASAVDCPIVGKALSEQDWSLLGDQDLWLYGYADLLAYFGGDFAIDLSYSAEVWTADDKSWPDGCQ